MVLGGPSLLNLIVAAGVVTLVVLVFQFLQGKRVIKFKGALHRKVHAATGLTLLVLAVVHGLLGLWWLLALK